MVEEEEDERRADERTEEEEDESRGRRRRRRNVASKSENHSQWFGEKQIYHQCCKMLAAPRAQHLNLYLKKEYEAPRRRYDPASQYQASNVAATQSKMV